MSSPLDMMRAKSKAGGTPEDETNRLLKAIYSCLKSDKPAKKTCPEPFTYEPTEPLDLAFVQGEDSLKLLVGKKIAMNVVYAIRNCLALGNTVTLAWINAADETICFQIQKEEESEDGMLFHFCGQGDTCVTSKVKKVTVHCDCEPELETAISCVDTNCVFSDPATIAGESAWVCAEFPGKIFRFNPETCLYEEVDKSTITLVKRGEDADRRCEMLKLPYVCANTDPNPTTLSCDELVQKALDNANANGITWPNGDPVTADPADFQYINSVTACVVCEGTPVKLADGTIFNPSNDSGSLCVNPNGGPNGIAFSCGAMEQQLGNGPLPLGRPITKADTVTIGVNAAISGVVTVSRCFHALTGEPLEP